MNERSELLQKLQQYDFMLYDLQLYLNSHPSCPEGRAKYCKYRELRDEAAREYANACGPFRAEQADTDSVWNWIDNPWPWEKEAN